MNFQIPIGTIVVMSIKRFHPSRSQDSSPSFLHRILKNSGSSHPLRKSSSRGKGPQTWISLHIPYTDTQLVPRDSTSFSLMVWVKPITSEKLKRVLAMDVIILLGESDNDPNHPYLRKTEGAITQGIHRFQRGTNFFSAAQNTAAELGCSCNWKLETVPNVGHNSPKMAKAGLKFLIKQ
eukprot:TRINITY_DN503_c0_g1_i6.p1 TRINITY_DN503_c0_g1~~TRINITY_DN503_c0_g1_i6.p1  ORF type:complete len:179 (-),score=15.56 TRINITY_DN503_c0_g1_i6:80-616(-)